MQRIWGLCSDRFDYGISNACFVHCLVLFPSKTSFSSVKICKKRCSPILWRKGFMIHEMTSQNMVFFKDDRPTFLLCWFISRHVLVVEYHRTKVSLSLPVLQSNGRFLGHPFVTPSPRFVNSWWCWWCACKWFCFQINTLMMHFLIVHVCCIFFFDVFFPTGHIDTKAGSPNCQNFWTAAAHGPFSKMVGDLQPRPTS